MTLLAILVATSLTNAPVGVIQGIQFYQLQHGQASHGQLPQYDGRFRSQANDDLAKRSLAFERCGASAAQPLSQTYGSAAIDRAKFAVIGSKDRDNGGLRVFVTALPARIGGAANLARTVDISCDVDWRGNVHKLSLGRND
jgi:hypothetical protein